MTTLEKAARAVQDEIGKIGLELRGPIHAVVVRAVLRSIRDPDGRMQRAFWQEMGDGASFSDGVRGYQAMIDAILAEGK